MAHEHEHEYEHVQRRPSGHAAPVAGGGARGASRDCLTIDLTTAQLAHELNSRLDGSMRAVRLAIRDLSGDGDAHALRRRLESAEGVMREMAAMLERAMCAKARKAPEGSPQFECAARALMTGRTLGEEAECVTALLRERAAESGICITLEMPSEAAARPAGPLGTILLNGLRNAIEAMEREAAQRMERRAPWQVDITAHERGGWLRLFVADNGPGLPVTDDSRHAGENEVSRGDTGSGHGLGLAICAQVAASLGGRVELMQPPHGPGLVLCAEVPVDRLCAA